MRFSVTIDISCEPEKVFSWMDDPKNAMQWQNGVKGGEIIKETPQKIGTIFKEEMEEDGKSLVMNGEITDYIPKKLISFHLVSKIHKVDVKYSVTGNDNKSKVLVESKVMWKFPMNFFSIFIGHKIKKKIYIQTQTELADLKRLCEKVH